MRAKHLGLSTVQWTGLAVVLLLIVGFAASKDTGISAGPSGTAAIINAQQSVTGASVQLITPSNATAADYAMTTDTSLGGLRAVNARVLTSDSLYSPGYPHQQVLLAGQVAGAYPNQWPGSHLTTQTAAPCGVFCTTSSSAYSRDSRYVQDNATSTGTPRVGIGAVANTWTYGLPGTTNAPHNINRGVTVTGINANPLGSIAITGAITDPGQQTAPSANTTSPTGTSHLDVLPASQELRGIGGPFNTNVLKSSIQSPTYTLAFRSGPIESRTNATPGTANGVGSQLLTAVGADTSPVLATLILMALIGFAAPATVRAFHRTAALSGGITDAHPASHRPVTAVDDGWIMGRQGVARRVIRFIDCGISWPSSRLPDLATRHRVINIALRPVVSMTLLAALAIMMVTSVVTGMAYATISIAFTVLGVAAVLLFKKFSASACPAPSAKMETAVGSTNHHGVPVHDLQFASVDDNVAIGSTAGEFDIVVNVLTVAHDDDIITFRPLPVPEDGARVTFAPGQTDGQYHDCFGQNDSCVFLADGHHVNNRPQDACISRVDTSGLDQSIVFHALASVGITDLQHSVAQGRTSRCLIASGAAQMVDITRFAARREAAMGPGPRYHDRLVDTATHRSMSGTTRPWVDSHPVLLHTDCLEQVRVAA